MIFSSPSQWEALEHLTINAANFNPKIRTIQKILYFPGSPSLWVGGTATLGSSPYFVLQQINVVNFDHHKMKIAQKVLYLLSQFKMTWVSVATGWVCLVFDAC